MTFAMIKYSNLIARALLLTYTEAYSRVSSHSARVYKQDNPNGIGRRLSLFGNTDGSSCLTWFRKSGNRHMEWLSIGPHTE